MFKIKVRLNHQIASWVTGLMATAVAVSQSELLNGLLVIINRQPQGF